MWNLFRFIARFGDFFLYLLLLGISLVLLAQNRSQAGTRINRWTFNSINTVAEKINVIGAYYSLREQNLALQQENKKLYQQVYNRTSLPDTPQGYDFVPALVVNKHYRSAFDYIVLDKGSNDGILPGDGVISAQGAVGTVVALTGRFSKVITLYNPKFNLLVGKPHSDITGFLQPDYRIFPLLKVTDIPFEAKIHPGDSLVTTGNSLVFAPGLPVAEVMEVNIDTLSRTKELKVRPFTDFRKLHYTYVIHHRLRQTLDSLKNGT